MDESDADSVGEEESKPESQAAVSAPAAAPTNLRKSSSSADVNSGTVPRLSHARTTATALRRILPATAKPSDSAASSAQGDTGASVTRLPSAFQPPKSSTSFQMEQDDDGFAQVNHSANVLQLYVLCVLDSQIFTVLFGLYFHGAILCAKTMHLIITIFTVLSKCAKHVLNVSFIQVYVVDCYGSEAL